MMTLKISDFGVTKSSSRFKISGWHNVHGLIPAIAFYRGLTDITKNNNSTQRNGNIWSECWIISWVGENRTRNTFIHINIFKQEGCIRKDALHF